jgi:hypothetical protein
MSSLKAENIIKKDKMLKMLNKLSPDSPTMDPRELYVRDVCDSKSYSVKLPFKYDPVISEEYNSRIHCYWSISFE